MEKFFGYDNRRGDPNYRPYWYLSVKDSSQREVFFQRYFEDEYGSEEKAEAQASIDYEKFLAEVQSKEKNWSRISAELERSRFKTLDEAVFHVGWLESRLLVLDSLLDEFAREFYITTIISRSSKKGKEIIDGWRYVGQKVIVKRGGFVGTSEIYGTVKDNSLLAQYLLDKNYIEEDEEN